MIQHLEGGIVAKVNVLDGEPVKKGEVLLELNPQLVGSAYDASEQELENLIIQQKQLQAVEGKKEIDVAESASLNDRVEKSQQKLLASRLTQQGRSSRRIRSLRPGKTGEVNGLDAQIVLQRRRWRCGLNSSSLEHPPGFSW